MSDATRQELLDALAEIGEVAPDMRFGQTIANLVTLARGPGSQTEWAEAVWDIEDSELLACATETASAWRERLAGPEPSPPPAMVRPTGEGRTPENVRANWSSLIEMLLGFAEGHPSVLNEERDREAIAALRRVLDRPQAAATSRRNPSIVS